MAVSGVFAADFSQFNDAVTQSTAKLRQLETEAGNVETAVDRMTSGSAQDLNAMSASAEKANTELEKMGDAPEGMKQFSKETQNATQGADTFTGSLKSMAIAFVSVQTAQAAWNFTKQIMEDAGALADLSAQTRISTDDLQFMGQAMATFGVDTDQMGRAVFKLSQAIAKGDDSVVAAIESMGLSIQQVKNLRGAELFETIQTGLAGLHGEMRDTAAVALYGEKLGMAMSGAAEGTRDAIAAAKEHNRIISKESVAALDEFDEALQRTSNDLKVVAANMLGPLLNAANKLKEANRQGASDMEIQIAILKDWWTEWGRGTPTVENLTRVFDKYNQQAAATAAANEKTTTTATAFVGPMISQAESTKRAADETKRLADNLKIADTEAQAFLKRQAANEAGIELMERDARLMADRAKFDAEQEVIRQKKLEAGAGWVKMMGETAARTKELQDAEKELQKTQAAGVVVIGQTAAEHEKAGKAAAAATAETKQGYQAVTQQVEISGDAIRAWIALMQYTNKANAILNRNSLFTTSGQLEEIANIAIPSFAGGVQDFAGGVARVHQDELLVNLPSGTSVIPKGNGGGTVVSNTFYLTDTESNLARRVSETIMRTVRAGTQLGQA